MVRCAVCRQREATHYPDGTGAMDIIHGAQPSVCEICGLREWFAKYEAMHAKASELAVRLVALLKDEDDGFPKCPQGGRCEGDCEPGCYEEPDLDPNETIEVVPMHPDTVKALSELGIPLPNWQPLLSVEHLGDPYHLNDPEVGICMNCGAEMDYNPMWPWCPDCDDTDG